MRKKWFEIWGEQNAQNSFLKVLLFLMIPILLVQSISIVLLASKKQLTLGLSGEETRELTFAPEALIQKEVSRTLKSYMEARYNWPVGRAEVAAQKALAWIDSAKQKSFLESQVAQIKIASERRIGQKFFVTNLKVDPRNNTAEVEGERILIVSNLRASNLQKFKISFESGPRTSKNPEGIYITDEAALSTQ